MSRPTRSAGAKRRGFWLADGRAGAGVHFLDRHFQRLHLAYHVEHGKRADAIGDEIGRVFRGDDAFAEAQVADFVERLQDFRKRLGTGDQLDQFHVTRRIEEMRSGPVLLKIFGAAFSDQMNRQARGVRSDDGARFADRFDAL